MSYGRDPDHATRGAGAIAALDRPRGPRAVKRIQSARATIRRDAAMSAVTRGALGRIDRAVLESGKRDIRPAPRPMAATIGVKVAPTFTSPTPIRAPSAVSNPTMATAPLATVATLNRMPPTIRPVESPPIIALPPVAATPGTVTTVTTRSTGGGGSGTVATTGGTRPPVSITPTAAMPPLVIDPQATDSPELRNYLIAGGIGLVALFFLMRKRGK